jgi:BolA family transcriptional regulator, general stress-responsive regulator
MTSAGPLDGRLDRIRAALTAAFAPQHLVIEDDSHLHAGHAGAATGRGHFRVEIVAAAFEGQPVLARHRKVYAALGELMDSDIHALSIQARAPGEAG